MGAPGRGDPVSAVCFSTRHTAGDDALVDLLHGQRRLAAGELQVDVVEVAQRAHVQPEALVVVRHHLR